MIQLLRLSHWTKKFEPNKEFLQQLGQTTTKSDLPVTPLFGSRTEKEAKRLNELREEFRDDVTKILLDQRSTSDLQIISIGSTRVENVQLPKFSAEEKRADAVFFSPLTRLIGEETEKSSRPIDRSFVLVEVTHDPSKCSADRRCDDESSLSYENNPDDSTTFSITVEQNDEFFYN